MRTTSVYTSALARRPRMTAVQFPRFEFQEGDDVCFSALRQRAEKKDWLSARMFHVLCNPLEVVATKEVNIRRQTGWWGKFHKATAEVMPSMLQNDPES